MKLLVLFLLSLALPAQTTDDDYIRTAHEAWNRAAKLANDWASQHNEYTVSKTDKERFHDYLKAERDMERAFKQIGYK